MNDLFVLLLVGFVVAIVLNTGSQPGPPSVMYIPVEVPRSSKSGCMPMIIILLVMVLFAMLLVGR
jgi:hypothetical protein